MDLLPYDKRYVGKGQGFTNIGNTCYMNSLLQCLLSCPVIFETLEANKEKDHIISNSLAQNMMLLSRAFIAGEPIHNKCIPVWRDIIRISQNRKDRVKLDFSQQDAHEGLMLFLDAMDSIPEIKRLFEHRHRIQIVCDQCKKCVVDKAESNLVIEVQPDLKTEQVEQFKNVDEFYNTSMPLNEFLRKQNGYVDKDFVCPNAECKSVLHKFKVTTLTMVPEILPIVLKKYLQKPATPFPAKLEFLARGGTKRIIYELVAQSEHAGSMGGGHYWAIALRNEGDQLVWKTLNDSNASDGKAGPTPFSYVLFYNFVRLEDVKSGDLVMQQVITPVVQPDSQSSIQTVVPPETQSVVPPETQSVVQPKTQSVVQPETQPIVQPNIQPKNTNEDFDFDKI